MFQGPRFEPPATYWLLSFWSTLRKAHGGLKAPKSPKLAFDTESLAQSSCSGRDVFLQGLQLELV